MALMIRVYRILTLATLILALTACRSETTSRPNFVVILTDDQHVASADYMPIMQAKLAAHGVTAEQAFVTIPECCPFRASFLGAGHLPANTGVLTNRALNGGAKNFDDADTLARRLSESGYRTGFVGKYLHGYRPGDVPGGWDLFVAHDPKGLMRQDWSNQKNVTFGGLESEYPDGRIKDEIDQYVTDFHRDIALQFLNGKDSRPFFFLLSAYAPHMPATAAKQDEGTFETEPLSTYREQDVSDKPEWVQQSQRLANRRCPIRTDKWRAQLRSLQALDRAIGALIDALERSGELNNTYIIFTSDNGVQAHNCDILFDKGMPYEGSIKVPLIIRGPGVVHGRSDGLIAVNLDVPRTILALAGAREASDGRDLRPWLESRSPIRTELLIENFGYLAYRNSIERPPIWAGLRTPRWKYVEHASGEIELYDLEADPNELDSRHNDPNLRDIRAQLARRLHDAPRALAITSPHKATGRAGEPFRFQLSAWGGTPPYRWRVKGGLPPGLALDSETGLISGVPRRAGRAIRTVSVFDGSRGAQNGRASMFNMQVLFEIDAAQVGGSPQ